MEYLRRTFTTYKTVKISFQRIINTFVRREIDVPRRTFFRELNFPVFLECIQAFWISEGIPEVFHTVLGISSWREIVRYIDEKFANVEEMFVLQGYSRPLYGHTGISHDGYFKNHEWMLQHHTTTLKLLFLTKAFDDYGHF